MLSLNTFRDAIYKEQYLHGKLAILKQGLRKSISISPVKAIHVKGRQIVLNYEL